MQFYPVVRHNPFYLLIRSIIQLKYLLSIFLDLLLFRKGPQDMPASQSLLLLSIVISSLLSMVAHLHIGETFTRAIFSTLLAILVLAVATRILLSSMGLAMRFEQTFTALCGTDILFTLFSWPVIITAMGYQANVSSAANDFAIFAHYLFWIILIWSTAVMAHIFRNALQKPFPVGLLVSLSYFLVMKYLLLLLFPESSSAS